MPRVGVMGAAVFLLAAVPRVGVMGQQCSFQLCVLGILGCLGNLSQLSRASTEFSLLSVPVALSGFTKMHGVCSLKWCWATSLLQDEQLLAGTKRALVGVTQSVPGCYGNCWESWLQFFILW